MDLSNVQMATLLPSWMKRQADDVALSESVDRAGREVYTASRLLTIWDKIDQLPEGVLDELAWALDIEWYDYDASIDVKRSLIRESDFVHSKKGTPAAVESVVASYFGTGRIMEWFEYGGEPHHFKVFTTDPSATYEDNLIKFVDRLGKVKRHSSKLDSIQIGLTGEEWLYIGRGSHDLSHETYQFGKTQSYVFPACAVVIKDKVEVQVDAMGTLRQWVREELDKFEIGDYNKLTNKPSIEKVELIGNRDLSAFGLEIPTADEIRSVIVKEINREEG